MYAIQITWADGTVTRAVVNRTTLRAFRLSSCGGASVKWHSV